MEYEQRDQVLGQKPPFSQGHADEGIQRAVVLEVFVDVLEGLEAVFMLNVHLETIDIFVRADALHAEQQVVELPVELLLVDDDLLVVALVVVNARVIVVVDVLHGVVIVLYLVETLLQIGGIIHFIISNMNGVLGFWGFGEIGRAHV